jgi:hypothetical protein
MAIVNISGKATRKMAKDHKSVSPIHKPASKPGVGEYSYSAPIKSVQDKKYNEKQM